MPSGAGEVVVVAVVAIVSAPALFSDGVAASATVTGPPIELGGCRSAVTAPSDALADVRVGASTMAALPVPTLLDLVPAVSVGFSPLVESLSGNSPALAVPMGRL